MAENVVGQLTVKLGIDRAQLQSGAQAAVSDIGDIQKALQEMGKYLTQAKKLLEKPLPAGSLEEQKKQANQILDYLAKFLVAYQDFNMVASNSWRNVASVAEKTNQVYAKTAQTAQRAIGDMISVSSNFGDIIKQAGDIIQNEIDSFDSSWKDVANDAAGYLDALPIEKTIARMDKLRQASELLLGALKGGTGESLGGVKIATVGAPASSAADTSAAADAAAKLATETQKTQENVSKISTAQAFEKLAAEITSAEARLSNFNKDLDSARKSIAEGGGSLNFWENLKSSISSTGSASKEAAEDIGKSTAALKEQTQAATAANVVIDEARQKYASNRAAGMSFQEALNRINRAARETGQSPLIAWLKSVEQAISVAVGPLNHFTFALNQVIRMIGSPMGMVTGVIAGVVMLGDAIYKTAQATIEWAKQYQEAIGVLTQATGSVNGAIQEYNDLREVALGTGTDIAKSASEFGRFQVALEGTDVTANEAKQLFVGIADASAAMRLPIESNERAFYALTQMAARSSVSMREVREFVRDTRIPMEELARASGLTVQQFEQQAKSGIDATEMLKKLGPELQKTYGPQAADNANTIVGATNNLHTSMGFLYEAIDKAFGVTTKWTASMNLAGAAARWLANQLPSAQQNIQDLQDQIAAVISEQGKWYAMNSDPTLLTQDAIQSQISATEDLKKKFQDLLKAQLDILHAGQSSDQQNVYSARGWHENSVAQGQAATEADKLQRIIKFLDTSLEHLHTMATVATGDISKWGEGAEKAAGATQTLFEKVEEVHSALTVVKSPDIGQAKLASDIENANRQYEKLVKTLQDAGANMADPKIVKALEQLKKELPEEADAKGAQQLAQHIQETYVKMTVLRGNTKEAADMFVTLMEKGPHALEIIRTAAQGAGLSIFDLALKVTGLDAALKKMEQTAALSQTFEEHGAQLQEDIDLLTKYGNIYGKIKLDKQQELSITKEALAYAHEHFESEDKAVARMKERAAQAEKLNNLLKVPTTGLDKPAIREASLDKLDDQLQKLKDEYAALTKGAQEYHKWANLKDIETQTDSYYKSLLQQNVATKKAKEEAQEYHDTLTKVKGLEPYVPIADEINKMKAQQADLIKGQGKYEEELVKLREAGPEALLSIQQAMGDVGDSTEETAKKMAELRLSIQRLQAADSTIDTINKKIRDMQAATAVMTGPLDVAVDYKKNEAILKDAEDYRQALKDSKRYSDAWIDSEVERYKTIEIEYEKAKHRLDDFASAGDIAAKSLQDAFQGFGDMFKKVMETGKLEMKDVLKMLDDMLIKIIQDIAEMALLKPLENAASSGISNFINGLLGTGISPSAGSTSGLIGTGGANQLGLPVNSAKGNIFDAGNIVPFARGGIINSPKIFPMADGAGLMGEAGPEAVMPLKRNSSGQLGIVAAGGSNVGSGDGTQQAPLVNITVNNNAHPDVHADVKQRANGQGGVDIELLINKAVAKNMRQGGVMHQGITQMFDTQPRVTQR